MGYAENKEDADPGEELGTRFCYKRFSFVEIVPIDFSLLLLLFFSFMNTMAHALSLLKS